MTDNRKPYPRSWVLLALLVFHISTATAQTPPSRLEVADPAPRAGERGESIITRSFVRDQTVLGLSVYGPSLAAALTNDPVAYAVAYLAVGGGSYLASSRLSRGLAMNEPTSWLATQVAVRGGLTGWALTFAAEGNRHHRAGGIFVGSVAGTVGAVALGRGMTDGEVAASLFGADIAALTGLAATHVAAPEATGRARARTVAAAGLFGYPLGYWYASRSAYRVSPGDVNTLWTGAAIGATAAAAFVASGDPSARSVATAFTAGALTGIFLADRFLVFPRDHTPREGQLVGLGAAAGGLMGAGVAMLSGAAHDRVSTASAALTAVGAVGGVIVAENWLAPRSDAGGTRGTLGRLALHPAAVLASAAKVRGTHTILSWTF